MLYVKPLISSRRDVVNYTRIHSAGARAQARAHIMRVRGAQGIRPNPGYMCIPLGASSLGDRLGAGIGHTCIVQ